MEYTAADYLAIVRRRILVIVAVVALFGVIAFGLQTSQDPTYVATSEVFLTPIIDPVSNTPQVSKRDTLVNMDTEQRLATSTAVAEAVRERLRITDQSARQLKAHVATAAVPETELLRIVYTASAPEQATDRAIAWAEEYLARRKAGVLADRADIIDSLQRQIDDATSDLADIAQEISTLAPGSADRFSAEARREAKQRLLTSLQDSLVTVTSASSNAGAVVNAPSSARTVKTFGSKELGAVLFAGIILGVALAFLIDRSDRRVRRADDIALRGLPVLGELSGSGYDAAAASRARSMLTGAQTDVHTILVAAADDVGAGAVVGANLARAYAAAGLRVAIVATDAENPELEKLLGVHATPGLSDAVDRQEPLETMLHEVAVPVGAIVALGSGSSGPWRPGLLARRDAQDQLRALGAHVDLLVIVAPPIDRSAVALDVAPMADECIVAVRRKVTSVAKLTQGVAELRKIGVAIPGTILVGRK